MDDNNKLYSQIIMIQHNVLIRNNGCAVELSSYYYKLNIDVILLNSSSLQKEKSVKMLNYYIYSTHFLDEY